MTHAISDNISVGIEEFITQLKRLNILWTLHTGVVVGDVSRIHNVFTTGVKLDGDDIVITANSLIGQLTGTTRVFVLSVPPSGTYIIGRIDSSTSVAPHIFNNIIANNITINELLTLNGTVSATNPTMKSVTNIQLADVTAFTNTTYQAGAVICGFSFTAPPSGIGRLFWHCNIRPNTANKASLTVQVREGTTLNAGTIVLIADEDWSIGATGSNEELGTGMYRPVTGLTPGASYNAVTLHKMSGGNGTIFIRSITWVPEW